MLSLETLVLCFLQMLESEDGMLIWRSYRHFGEDNYGINKEWYRKREARGKYCSPWQKEAAAWLGVTREDVVVEGTVKMCHFTVTASENQMVTIVINVTMGCLLQAPIFDLL